MRRRHDEESPSTSTENWFFGGMKKSIDAQSYIALNRTTLTNLHTYPCLNQLQARSTSRCCVVQGVPIAKTQEFNSIH